jgi:hypothetical protein
MTRKAFIALCASVLAAPFVMKRNNTPAKPDPPRFTFTPTREFDGLYRQILDGQRLYGLGTWETKQGDAN